MLKTNAPKKHHLRKIPEQIILFPTLNAVIITIKFLGLSTLLNARSFILKSTFKLTRKTTWIFLRWLIWVAEEPEGRILIVIILETNTAWTTFAEFISWVNSSPTSWILAKVGIVSNCTCTSWCWSSSRNWKQGWIAILSLSFGREPKVQCVLIRVRLPFLIIPRVKWFSLHNFEKKI